jgi:prophage DNA circulation protein
MLENLIECDIATLPPATPEELKARVEQQSLGLYLFLNDQSLKKFQSAVKKGINDVRSGCKTIQDLNYSLRSTLENLLNIPSRGDTHKKHICTRKDVHWSRLKRPQEKHPV